MWLLAVGTVSSPRAVQIAVRCAIKAVKKHLFKRKLPFRKLLKKAAKGQIKKVEMHR
jgi:hypothetical protein